MMKNQESGTSPANQPSSDKPGILRALFQRRLRAWIFTGVVAFLVSLVLALNVFPQYFTSNASLSMAQPSASMQGIAALMGMPTGARKYLGILKSRQFAEDIEKEVHLQQLYALKRHSDAIEKIQKATKFDDNATDGLIYIEVTLDAPARFSPIPKDKAKSEQIRQAVVQITNMYPELLLQFMKTQDDDKELVLLRAADAEVQKARQDYDASVNTLMAFVRNRHIRPNVAVGMVMGASSMSAGMTGGSSSPSLGGSGGGLGGSSSLSGSPS
ncbi:MAG TPA: hypothetical protein VKU00_19975, partial [Chthonomonadaceae bacterium]|nr:hypothetical protein [Chthonomonadaceae bacterium]